MTTKKQCFLYTTWQLHIWTHSGCVSMQKTSEAQGVARGYWQLVAAGEETFFFKGMAPNKVDHTQVDDHIPKNIWAVKFGVVNGLKKKGKQNLKLGG